MKEVNGLQRGHEARRKKRNPWTAVLVIALIVLVASLTALAVIWFSYFQGQQKYDHIAESIQVPDKPDQGGAGDELGAFVVDWGSLLAANPDTVAWVNIPGTNVNYPVVRGTDNEYYLTHDFEGAQGWLASYGTVFMDYRNNPNWSDRAYFVYGHHMNDGSMFADVAGLRDQATFDSCRTVYLLSPTTNYKLRTFSLLHCSADDELVQTGFPTREAMVAYVQDKMNRSIVDAGTIPPADSMTQVFAFATCDNFEGGRYVLYAYAEQVEGPQPALAVLPEEAEFAETAQSKKPEE